MTWKLGLHSVSYAGVWAGQASLTLDEFVDRAASLGYNGVMLMAKRNHASPLDLSPDRRKALRDRLQERGLELACLAAYTDFTVSPDHADIPFVEMQTMYVEECAGLAHDLGGNIVRIFTGFERPDLGPGRGWSRCVSAIKECARRAADHSVILAVQNHHDIALHHEALFDLLTEVDEPNAKAGFDAWAPALQGLAGEPLAESVRHMAPFIAQTVVADYRHRPRYHLVPSLSTYAPDQDGVIAVPVGEGFVDYPSFFAALHEVRYDGYVTYEMCWPLQGGGCLENLDRCARRFVDWMRQYATAREN